MVYKLAEEDKLCGVIYPTYEGFSPIPKATCEMLESKCDKTEIIVKCGEDQTEKEHTEENPQSVSTSESTSTSASDSTSESVSQSSSSSVSTSVSNSVSESTSTSESTSESTSVSDSTSTSESTSESQASTSESTSESTSTESTSESTSAESTSTSESTTSTSESTSDSTSTSKSDSTSSSESTSTSESNSVSESTSESTSTESTSTSESNSGSESTSTSESVSESATTSESNSVSESTSLSESTSTSESISDSTSTTVSTSESTTTSTSTSEPLSESELASTSLKELTSEEFIAHSNTADEIRNNLETVNEILNGVYDRIIAVTRGETYTPEDLKKFVEDVAKEMSNNFTGDEDYTKLFNIDKVVIDPKYKMDKDHEPAKVPLIIDISLPWGGKRTQIEPVGVNYVDPTPKEEPEAPEVDIDKIVRENIPNVGGKSIDYFGGRSKISYILINNNKGVSDDSIKQTEELLSRELEHNLNVNYTGSNPYKVSTKIKQVAKIGDAYNPNLLDRDTFEVTYSVTKPNGEVLEKVIMALTYPTDTL